MPEHHRIESDGHPTASFSVIIPACNEQFRIKDLLAELYELAESGVAEIVVVCNGCTDDTVVTARSVSPLIQVTETSTASKTHALNIGDETATCFPRFYLDADLRISAKDLMKVYQAMIQHDIPAAAARIEYDTTKATWVVRRFYALWKRLPYATENGIGVGMYALSRSGRSRFGQFPDTFADDLFVQMLFDSSERLSVSEAEARVPAPQNLYGLLVCRSRQYLGKKEIQMLMPQPSSALRRRQTNAIWRLMANPKLWGDIVLFATVHTISMALYLWKYRILHGRHWDRSRCPPESHDR